MTTMIPALGFNQLSIGQLCLAWTIIGVLSHLLYFIRGHRFMQTVQIAAGHLVSAFLVGVPCVTSQGIRQGTLLAGAISSSYLLGLFTSMSIYRVLFHRLGRFPGPFAAKLTKFYGPWIARNGKMHLEQNVLLDKYGDFVRIGPNELLVLSMDAQQKVHGATSKCLKANTIYDTVHYEGEANLDTLGNRQDHRRRRQIWDKALNTKSLASYEEYVREVVYEWLDKIHSLKGQPINTSLYSTLISFENMGRMGFSTNFGSIKAGKEDPMLHLIEVTLANIAGLGQMPWPVVLLSGLGLGGEHAQFEKMACEMTDMRIEKGDDAHEDLMKYFLQDFHAEQPKSFFNRNILYADSQAVIIGGTDTIAAALSFAFYNIAKDPEVRRKIREELKPLFGRTKPGEFTNGDLGGADAEYLNAVITETLRMDNPTCNNVPRMTPPEGIEVDGMHIPGDVSIFVPIHAFHRCEKYFMEPNEFIPERWTTRPELVLDKRAFHPFLLGPFNCVGKRLALIVIRLVLAYTLWNYDFEFAPGEDGTAIHRDAINQLIIKAGKLECTFHPR